MQWPAQTNTCVPLVGPPPFPSHLRQFLAILVKLREYLFRGAGTVVRRET